MPFAVGLTGVFRQSPAICSSGSARRSPLALPSLTSARSFWKPRVASAAASSDSGSSAAEAGAAPSAPPIDAAPIEVQAAVGPAAAAQTPSPAQEPSVGESKAAAGANHAAQAEGGFSPASVEWMQEVIKELADTSKLGTRGEAWFVAQLVLILLVVIPPTLWLKTFIDGLGWLTVLAGVGLMAAGQQSLGQNLTPLPKPRDNNQLVTSGIYKLCRHPMYGGLLLAAFGLTLATGSEVRLVLSIILALVMSEKANYEEKFLEERYGGEYTEYKKQTKKLIPFVF